MWNNCCVLEFQYIRKEKQVPLEFWRSPGIGYPFSNAHSSCGHQSRILGSYEKDIGKEIWHSWSIEYWSKVCYP